MKLAKLLGGRAAGEVASDRPVADRPTGFAIERGSETKRSEMKQNAIWADAGKGTTGSGHLRAGQFFFARVYPASHTLDPAGASNLVGRSAAGSVT